MKPSAKRYLPLLAYLAALVLLFLQRPSDITDAQFWAEDGTVFFAAAFNEGPLAVFFEPYAGYLHLLPRLAASLALLVPLVWAPAVMNGLALAMQALPAALLASERLLKGTWTCLMAVVLYIGLPLTAQMQANAANAQHFLALAAVLIVVSETRGRLWKVFDASVLTLFALSSPLVVLLAPLALVWWLHRRALPLEGAPALKNAAILGAGAAVQASCALLSQSPRSLAMESPAAAASLAVKALTVPVAGTQGYATILSYPALAFVAAICGAAGFVYLLARGPAALKALAVFGAVALALGVLFPTSGNTEGAWTRLATPDSGGRYFILSSVAVLGTLLWLSGKRILRYAAIPVLICALVFGGDWQDERVDLDYKEQIRAENEVIRIPPNWTMRLQR